MERGIREEQKSVREILFDAEKKRKRFTVICRKAAERQDNLQVPYDQM